jgi:hypothetical protein
MSENGVQKEDQEYERITRDFKSHDLVLELLDILYAVIIVGPLVVSFWRGTWALIILYIYPSNPTISCCISLAMGIMTHLVFTMAKSKMGKTLHPNRNRLSFYLLSRLYTYFYAIMCVNCWRGYFGLLDIYMTNEMAIHALTIISALVLCVLKSIRNVVATPYVLFTDTHDKYFYVPTYFKSVNRKLETDAKNSNSKFRLLIAPFSSISGF